MKAIIYCAFSAVLLIMASTGSAQNPVPSDVGVRDMGGGTLFVNSDGLTLYTFKRDREQPGSSVCVEECAAIWPPVTASANASSMGAWTVIQRPDGTPQWAYDNQPVYTYAKDTHSGAIVGEKASSFWDVLYEPIDTPPDVSIRASIKGQMLTDLLGRTIYASSDANCDETCMKPWLPVEAPWLARALDEDWTIVQRDDGLKQWAYKTQPLYTYTGDFTALETNGEDADGAWSVVVLQDAPAIPDWITFQETDIGPVMATSDRMTLYYLVNDPEQIRRETCDDACVAENWDALIAPDGMEPIGNWTTTELSDGRRQWLYLGYPVYTFKHDGMPGDTYGDKFGTGSEIRGGWTAILRETLIQKLSS